MTFKGLKSSFAILYKVGFFFIIYLLVVGGLIELLFQVTAYSCLLIVDGRQLFCSNEPFCVFF